MLVVTKRDQPVANAVPPDEPANLIGTNYSFWPSGRFWDTDGCYPMLVEAEGIPPPQYAAVDDQ